jgi:hypothetical protein
MKRRTGEMLVSKTGTPMAKSGMRIAAPREVFTEPKMERPAIVYPRNVPLRPPIHFPVITRLRVAGNKGAGRSCNKAMGQVRHHVEERLITHLRKRHNVRERKTGYVRFKYRALYVVREVRALQSADNSGLEG